MKKFNNYSMPKFLAWMSASLLVMLVAGCGGGNPGGTGTVGVSLTDAPACGFEAVNVTVAKVRVHQSGTASDTDAGWTDITLNPARKINLLDLTNGALDSLGEAPLAAGHYTQLRLVLRPNSPANPFANSIVPTGGIETALVTPSATQSGIKLINEFDVAAGYRVDLVLDFNACKSIVKRGNGTYALKPVIKVLPYALNGIDGFVDTALLSSNIIVSAQQNGIIVQSTIPDTGGAFFLSRLAPGNYDVVINADGHSTAVIATVPVTSTTSIVNVSKSIAPITLPVSATHIVSGTATLSPPSLTEVAYVAAKQIFGAALTVTEKSVAADDLTGAYTMTLPIDAPLLGQYVTPLPIVFTAQSGVVGLYTMEASVIGYQTSLPVNVDISAADATQSFALVQ